MFALSVRACRLSNILLPADYLRAHRAVMAGQSRPLTPHLRGQPRPQRSSTGVSHDLRSGPTGDKVQPVKKKRRRSCGDGREPLDEREKGRDSIGLILGGLPPHPPHPRHPSKCAFKQHCRRLLSSSSALKHFYNQTLLLRETRACSFFKRANQP